VILRPAYDVVPSPFIGLFNWALNQTIDRRSCRPFVEYHPVVELCIIIPACSPEVLGLCVVYGAKFKTIDAALTPPFILDGITRNFGGEAWRQWGKGYVFGILDQYGLPRFPSMADAQQCCPLRRNNPCAQSAGTLERSTEVYACGN